MMPSAQKFAINIAVAFLPLAILGLIFGKAIKAHLFAPVPVALAFIIGGFIILWAEKREHTHPGRKYRGPELAPMQSSWAWHKPWH